MDRRLDSSDMRASGFLLSTPQHQIDRLFTPYSTPWWAKVPGGDGALR